MSDVWGYADLHCHPMAHLAFGGKQSNHRLFWGEPTGPADQALACCGPSHSMWKTFLPFLVEEKHGESGYPDFRDWPTATTLIHQQMYWEWIKRAHASGLRLICALAVNNEYLPHLYHGGYHAKNSDHEAIGAQLAGMQRMITEHSAWMEIALTPAHARRIISDGKLAVVLGVEVDSLGGWRRPEDATEVAAGKLVDDLFAKGVRTLTPIHLANNAIGGCACFRDAFNILNHWLNRNTPTAANGGFWEVDAKVDTSGLRGVEFVLGRDAEDTRLRNVYTHKFPAYARQDGHINRVGLSPIGSSFIKRMMQRGMLLDIDHMSQHSRDDVMQIAEHTQYPVVSSHSGFRDLGLRRAEATNQQLRGVKNEFMLERAFLQRIRALGGIVAPATRVGPVSTTFAHPSRPDFKATPNQDTALSWAHAYLYATEVMGDAGGVGVGTDFNGLSMQPHGRFANVNPIGVPRRVQYGVDQMVQTTELLRQSDSPGKRKYDFNRDGLAHYGLLPDFVRDIANQYGSDEPLVPFFRSAQRFIETWERCEAASARVV
ncbi:MAG TPA: membrane dipeptidase [Polyangiales bacterium]|nr:membrane dipeptidase [Polyangiales bacterium]